VFPLRAFAKQIAEIKNVSQEVVAEQTSRNFEILFGVAKLTEVSHEEVRQ